MIVVLFISSLISYVVIIIGLITGIRTNSIFITLLLYFIFTPVFSLIITVIILKFVYILYKLVANENIVLKLRKKDAAKTLLYSSSIYRGRTIKVKEDGRKIRIK